MDHLCTQPINDRRPSVLDSALALAFPLLILTFAAVIIALVCEALARLAVPLPEEASPELQQSVANQREAVVTFLFGAAGALFVAWAVFSS